tara:strand:- start:1225 stop:1677 length:453 start_codon:yes stop_codon:yes gene_type:complete
MAQSFFQDDPFVVKKEKIIAHKMIESMVKLDDEGGRGTTQLKGKWIEADPNMWMPENWEEEMIGTLTGLEDRTYWWVNNSKLPLEICESIARYELNKLPSKQQVKHNLKHYIKKERRREIQYKDNPELERLDKNEFVKQLNKSKNNIVFF